MPSSYMSCILVLVSDDRKIIRPRAVIVTRRVTTLNAAGISQMSQAKLPHVQTDSSDDDEPATKLPHVHRRKSVDKLLGGRKVSDVLLWRNRNLSAGILAGATLVWFLFDVVEYNVVTLLCHIALLGMLLLFIWSNAAPFFDRPPPQIPEVIVSEQAFREVAQNIHYKLAHFVSILYDVACGKDLKKFLMVIGSLWILAILGDTCSFTTLLYVGFLCALTLPALYERYETEVDHLVAKGHEDLKKFYKKVDSNVLNKIPRGPVKTKVL